MITEVPSLSSPDTPPRFSASLKVIPAASVQPGATSVSISILIAVFVESGAPSAFPTEDE